MSQEGRGIAARAGKIVFVSGALEGELVRVRCTEVKRDYDAADLIELDSDVTPSVQRVQPECPVHERCGGCSLQYWALTAQQQHKQASLSTMLRAINPSLQPDPPITGLSSGFRHRLRLQVKRSADRGYSLGLRQRGSHDAVTLQHCLIANSAVNAFLKCLPDILLTAPDLQGLREIEIDADSSDQIGLCFYFSANPGEKIISALRAAIMTHPVIALRVRLNTQRKTSGDTQYAEAENMTNWQDLHAEGELWLQLGSPVVPPGGTREELRLGYLPGDFTQTHWDINTALVDRGLEWLQPGKDEQALDLFSGIGNFSLPMALRAKTVHAIEGDNTMALRVATNARRNGLENITAKTQNLMADEVPLPRAEIAIIDPPRAGAKAVCNTLARSKLKRLLYVSCHPATLVRDARVLHAAGLRLTKAALVDMFPHTGHSEAIALFERK